MPLWNLERYSRPATLGRIPPGATLIAGGAQVVGRDDTSTREVVDLTAAVPAFVQTGKTLRIGAPTSLQELLRCDALADFADGVLHQALRAASPSVMVRHASTLAGTPSPAVRAVLQVLGASRPQGVWREIDVPLPGPQEGFSLQCASALPSSPPIAVVAVRVHQSAEIHAAWPEPDGPYADHLRDVLMGRALRQARERAEANRTGWRRDIAVPERRAPPYESGPVAFTLNGKPFEAEVPPGRLLLHLLRELRLFSVKHGCETGECGACCVSVDGRPMNSCTLLAAQVHGRSVRTLESIGTFEAPHPLQSAFVDAGAIQCGYCTPGMILSACALREEHPHPTEAQVRDALAGNLCRCTGYVKPVQACMTL